MTATAPSAPAADGPRTILVVEDETGIAEAVATRLRSEGFVVHLAADGPTGVQASHDLDPDLVVLDLMLPGLDGLDVCRAIQAERPVPVLMLTARDSEADLLEGLATGADDYLTKPFSARELVARVHALLRTVERAALSSASSAAPGGANAAPVTLGAACLDPVTREATGPTGPVHLTPTEFDLAVHLATDPRRVFTREELLETVWGYPSGGGTRTVDSHVRALRRKLGNEVVRTVHGVGYGAGAGIAAGADHDGAGA
jgi:DNA-binding response OmpR family regulator